VSIGAQKMMLVYRLKAGWKRIAIAALSCASSHVQVFFTRLWPATYQVEGGAGYLRVVGVFVSAVILFNDPLDG